MESLGDLLFPETVWFSEKFAGSYKIRLNREQCSGLCEHNTRENRRLKNQNSSLNGNIRSLIAQDVTFGSSVKLTYCESVCLSFTL